MKRFLFIIILLTVIIFNFNCSKFRLKTVKFRKVKSTGFTINKKLESDSEIINLVKPYKNKMKTSVEEVIGTAKKTITKKFEDGGSLIGYFVTDAMLEMGQKFTKQKKIDFAVTNKGGLRSEIPKGDIKIKHLFQLMPFDNKLVLCDMTGEHVKQLCEEFMKSWSGFPVSGLYIKWDKEKKKILQIKVQGKPLVDDKIYKVATIDFIFGGGDKIKSFKYAKNENFTTYFLRDLLIDYIKKHKTINPKKERRIEIE